MQVSNEILLLTNGVAKFVKCESQYKEDNSVEVKEDKRYLLLSDFKKIFIKKYNFKNVNDEKKNIKYFDNYIKFNTPFYEYLLKNPGLINKLIISTSSCYYSTPISIQGDFKQIIDYFISNYSDLEILDYSSHIGFDALFFSKFFKKVYVNDIDDVFLKILKINFTTLGINNFEICRDYKKMNNVDIVYFDPPFDGWDEKTGDYYYSGKKLQDVIAEFKNAQMIIIKHHKDLSYVDHTFNFIKHYNKHNPVDKTKIFVKISIMRAKPKVKNMQKKFLVSIPSYNSLICKILSNSGFNTN